MLRRLLWANGVDLAKVLNALGPLCLWQCLHYYTFMYSINTYLHIKENICPNYGGEVCTGGSGALPQNSNGGNCDKIKIREKRNREKNWEDASKQKNERWMWIIINQKFYGEVCTGSPHLEFQWGQLWQNQNQGEIGLPKKLPHCCRSWQGMRIFMKTNCSQYIEGTMFTLLLLLLFTIHWRHVKLTQALTNDEQTSTDTKNIIKMIKVIMVTKLININKTK